MWLIYFLGMTTQGLVLDLVFAAKFLPGKLQVLHVDGKLISGFSLKNISWKNSEYSVQIKSFTFVWKPSDLFQQKLTIESFILDQAIIKHAAFKIDLNGEAEKKLRWHITSPPSETYFPDSSGFLSLHSGSNLQINLLDTRINVPVLGITPNQINVQATFAKKTLHFSGSFHSGKGTGTLHGQIDLKKPAISLAINGDYLQAIHLSEYKVEISPRVTIDFSDQSMKLRGNVLVPYADISPENFSSIVTLPDDVILAGQKKSLPFTLSLQLNLQAGNKINITYKNLESKIAGNVQITQSGNGLAIATGELYTINGTYKAYGQTLNIQNGRLLYTGGSLTNPGLNIAAVKQIKMAGMDGGNSQFSTATLLKPIYTGTRSVTAGVRVTGTLNNPIYTLFSDPIMNQGDILSYLVFGYPQSQAGSGAGGAILSALSSMGPANGFSHRATEKLEKTLRLNEINIESTPVFNPGKNTTETTTAFMVGKQLSPKLYLRYSIGLFNPVSILNLHYQLNDHWAVQSETSTLDNGADLLYRIESE